MKITFVGGGNMASALISGLFKHGYTASQISVVEINVAVRAQLESIYGIVAVTELQDAVSSATDSEDQHVIVLAVKPQQLHTVTLQLSGLLNRQLVMSIAAGIRAIDLSRWLGDYQRVIRAMPNTPSLVGAGVTGLYAASGVSEQDKQAAELIMKAVGSILWVPEEETLHAVTAISGSGPAYVFYFIETMQQAAIELGLTDAEAKQLSLQTFRGAIQLARESEDGVAELRRKVTSKGGTTQQAIDTMDTNAVKSGIRAGIQAAFLRSREMSEELGGANNE